MDRSLSYLFHCPDSKEFVTFFCANNIAKCPLIIVIVADIWDTFDGMSMFNFLTLGEQEDDILLHNSLFIILYHSETSQWHINYSEIFFKHYPLNLGKFSKEDFHQDLFFSGLTENGNFLMCFPASFQIFFVNISWTLF